MKIILLALAVLPLVAGSSLADSAWTGGGSTDPWSNTSNWSGDTSPDADDQVSLPGTGASGCDDASRLDASFTIRSLSIADAYSGVLTLSGYTLTVVGSGPAVTVARGDQINALTGSTLTIAGGGLPRTLAVSSGTLTVRNLRIECDPGTVVTMEGPLEVRGALTITGGKLVLHNTLRVLGNCTVGIGATLDASAATGPVVFGDDVTFMDAGGFIPHASLPVQFGLDADTVSGGAIMDLYMPGLHLKNVIVDSRRSGGGVARVAGSGGLIVDGELTLEHGKLSIVTSFLATDDMLIEPGGTFEMPTSGSGAAATFGDDFGDTLRVRGLMDLEGHPTNPGAFCVWASGTGHLDNGAAVIIDPGAVLRVHGATMEAHFSLVSTQPFTAGGNRWRFYANPSDCTLDLARTMIADSGANAPFYSPVIGPAGCLDGDNTRGWFPEVASVPGVAANGTMSLEAPSPNPFREATSMNIVLGEPGRVRIGVYDAQGRLVRQLLDSRAAAGRSAIRWDGRDSAGLPSASGTYFIRALLDGKRITQRVVLIR